MNDDKDEALVKNEDISLTVKEAQCMIGEALIIYSKIPDEELKTVESTNHWLKNHSPIPEEYLKASATAITELENHKATVKKNEARGISMEVTNEMALKKAVEHTVTSIGINATS